MSHAPERKEKDCLNCGTTIHGRYCHVCGQENLEPKESFWQLVMHFFSDITHFDGKFFVTVKDLFTRPGFLSKEYMKGRRASYLNPVRMYVFTSAIFFLIFFSFLYSEGSGYKMSINGKSMEQIEKMDSAQFAAFTSNINQNDDKPAVPMTREEFKQYADSVTRTAGLLIATNTRYRTKEEYDSLRALGSVKHGWIRRQFVYKEIALNQKYHNNPAEISNAFSHTFIHSLPQMLFISLPLMALILKLLYMRRKQFYYVGHGIFSLHLYIFFFIAILIIYPLGELNSRVDSGLLDFVITLLGIGIFVYEYLALKHFYGQGWFKTFLKFLLVNIMFGFMMGLIFLVFTLLSLFKI